ncbi:MAG: hypothetical protein KGL39_03395 [Patescibacteria group bacterium]|nr:hypothetical protein [Patescibacteria group bacterium]
MMRNTMTGLGAGLLLLVTACNGTGGTSAGSPGVNASQGVQLVSQACQAIAPTVQAVPTALSSASASDQAKAANILSYEEAVCGSANAINAVVSKDPSGGSNTAVWLTGIGAGLVQALPAILQATGAVRSAS